MRVSGNESKFEFVKIITIGNLFMFYNICIFSIMDYCVLLMLDRAFVQVKIANGNWYFGQMAKSFGGWSGIMRGPRMPRKRMLRKIREV